MEGVYEAHQVPFSLMSTRSHLDFGDEIKVKAESSDVFGLNQKPLLKTHSYYTRDVVELLVSMIFFFDFFPTAVRAA